MSEDQRARRAGGIATVVVAVTWILLKVAYREAIKERAGMFSWAYLKADLVSLAILVILGVVVYRLVMAAQPRA